MGLDTFFNAFMDLNTCRPTGFGVAPIPWTAIDAYCSRMELGQEQWEDMLYHLRALDAAYCVHRAKKDKS